MLPEIIFEITELYPRLVSRSTYRRTQSKQAGLAETFGNILPLYAEYKNPVESVDFTHCGDALSQIPHGSIISQL